MYEVYFALGGLLFGFALGWFAKTRFGTKVAADVATAQALAAKVKSDL